LSRLNRFSRRCLALAISQCITVQGFAANIVVDDDGDGESMATCTLRQAMTSAYLNSASESSCVSGTNDLDTISFSASVLASGTISLTQNQELSVTGSLAINGPSEGQLLVNGTGQRGVFYISDNANATISNLTISNGKGSTGGGIHISSSTVGLNNVIVSGNTASFGGGIFAGGSSSLSLVNTRVSNNIATDGSSRGGGILIVGSSSLSLSDSEIANNSAKFGGGISSGGSSEVSVSNTTIRSNSAGSNGWGIYAELSSNINLSGSTVSSNTASRGGGINLVNASASLSNSTVSNNSANLGAGFEALGSSSSLNVINTTVSANSAQTMGGAVTTDQSSINFINSIIAGNLAPAANEINVGAGASITSGNNLFGDASKYSATAFVNFTPNDSDITATVDGENPTAIAAILKPLESNDHTTHTHALVLGSPAVDAGNDAVCVAVPINNVDQRGEMRPIGRACDIGAYEFREQSSFFVVPLPDGKVVVFEL